MQNSNRQMTDHKVAVMYPPTPPNDWRIVNPCPYYQGTLNKDLYFVQNPDELILKELDQNFQEILEKEQHRNRQWTREIIKQYETKIITIFYNFFRKFSLEFYLYS